MPPANPLDILLAHDKWATDQMLLACEKLSADQLDKPFDIGPGTLRKTLTHMISAMNAWTDTLQNRPLRPRPDASGVAYSPADLRRMHDASTAELLEVSKKYPLDEIVTRVRDGKAHSFTRGTVLTHLATHGMHHRAQCLNMLKHLGVMPLPLSSVTEWAFTAV